MKSEKAVFPLMKLLRERKTLEERIIAALSLVKIGNTQGVYLVAVLQNFPIVKKQEECVKDFTPVIFIKNI